MNNKDFCVFIITHGRPNDVITFETLKKQNYTGKTYFIIDNTDKKADEYYNKFGKENVIMFDKEEIAKTTDHGDNFWNLRTTTHARNACFNIANKIGIKYFLVLDDDYTAFDFRLFIEKAIVKPVKNLDLLFDNMLEYFKTIKAVSICMAQGGDFIGGLDNGKELYRFSKRKAMNTWFCSTDRYFKFISRLNEDVNTYLTLGSVGNLFLTIPFCSITQKQTQGTKGGMTEAYLEGGTYVKTFYTVMYCPSFVKAKILNAKNKRIHHSMSWENAVPCIIDEKYKK
jgi:hypothetical protein